MEGNLRTEAPHPSPSVPSANIGRNHELTWSNSDASSLTAENREDILRRSLNMASDGGTAWTDEKHNSFLHHLEVSFVKQLHQSKSLLANCSEQMSEKQFTNVTNASEQFKVLWNGCCQKINCVRGEPLCGSSSADSCASLKSNRVNNFKRTGKHCHAPSAEIACPVELWHIVKHGKGTLSHGLATCSQECSSSEPYRGDLFYFKTEETGQNFLDEEDNQSTSNFESQAKKSTTALSESSLQDQVLTRADSR